MESSPAKRLDFIYFDAGGGHRAAATALQSVIERQGRPWRVRLVNLQEVLEPLDIFRKYLRIRMEDVYNQLLARGWTLGSPQLLVGMHWLIRLYHRGQVRMLARYWAEDTPDLVVSFVPNFNRAIFQGLRKVTPDVPLVSVITDIADYPPHFWIERQDQYFVCGSAKAVEQAKSLGHSDERIVRTSGMILRPRFYDPVVCERREERLKLGLDPDVPTGLVLFGGAGSSVMVDIARRLQSCRKPLQLIFLCGRNVKLAERLKRIRGPVKLHVEGFTHEVPYFMHLSDFLIGKPGPGSISEALAMKLPVIVERNAWTLPQERYNADWVREANVGIVLPNFRQIVPAVESLLEPGRLDELRANAAALNNRAVFEIPDFLETLLR